MASAIWRGARLKVRAPTMAALQAKSPWAVSAGISTAKSGRGASGSAPSAMALASAAETIWATCSLACLTRLDMMYFFPFCWGARRGGPCTCAGAQRAARELFAAGGQRKNRDAADRRPWGGSYTFCAVRRGQRLPAGSNWTGLWRKKRVGGGPPGRAKRYAPRYRCCFRSRSRDLRRWCRRR